MGLVRLIALDEAGPRIVGLAYLLWASLLRSSNLPSLGVLVQPDKHADKHATLGHTYGDQSAGV